MRVVTGLGSLALGAIVLLGVSAGEDTATKPSVADVMQQAHKGGLLKKVKGGDASQAEKQQLLKLYIALWENEPPQGDVASWKEKTGTLVVGAAKVVLGEGAAESALTVNCAACHKVHKPS